MSNLRWRSAGVVLLAVCIVLYDPNSTDPARRVGVPLGMAVAAWLLVQNLAAVAFGTSLLAAIHGDPGSSDPVLAMIYPAIAAGSAVLLALILLQRFRRRISATHEARWRHRRAGATDPDAGDAATGCGTSRTSNR